MGCLNTLAASAELPFYSGDDACRKLKACDAEITRFRARSVRKETFLAVPFPLRFVSSTAVLRYSSPASSRDGYTHCRIWDFRRRSVHEQPPSQAVGSCRLGLSERLQSLLARAFRA